VTNYFLSQPPQQGVRDALPQTPETARSTYLRFGGVEREAAIADLWRLVRHRAHRKEVVGLQDVRVCVERIDPEWGDDEHTVVSALLGCAYRDILVEVEAVSAAYEERARTQRRQLLRLRHAHLAYRVAEQLSIGLSAAAPETIDRTRQGVSAAPSSASRLPAGEPMSRATKASTLVEAVTLDP
jgi:hypothetical protein